MTPGQLHSGWSLESESPLVLRHRDGSQVTGAAADSLLPLLLGCELETVPTPQRYAIWRNGTARLTGWLSDFPLPAQQVGLWSRDEADAFVHGFDELVVRPVFLMTPRVTAPD
jgi:hypothetical protein